MCVCGIKGAKSSAIYIYIYVYVIRTQKHTTARSATNWPNMSANRARRVFALGVSIVVESVYIRGALCGSVSRLCEMCVCVVSVCIYIYNPWSICT